MQKCYIIRENIKVAYKVLINTQVQHWLRDYREKDLANKISEIKKFIKKKLRTEKTADKQYYFFNVNLNETGEVVLGDGSEEDHLMIFMTSKSLMQNVELEGLYHIDGTYKITIQGYPLVVFGVSDLHGQFHPIAFMLTSNEKEIEFSIFYEALKIESESLDLEFEPEFILQDAQQSSHNAALKSFPNVIILMCYWHMLENVRKNVKPLLPEKRYEQLKEDLKEMHMAVSEDDFENLREKFFVTYKKFPKTCTYMEKQWLSGDFSKWQIFHTPPGYASSQGCIESFNSTFKADYTNYRKLNIKETIEAVAKCIVYYSNEISQKKFMKCPKFNKKLLQLSRHLNATNFKKLNQNKVKYIGTKNQFVINLNDNRKSCYMKASCSCSNFLKHAICHHLVAYADLNNLKIFDENYLKAKQDYLEHTKNFVMKTARGRKKNKNGRYKHAEPALIRDE